ncbi:MULTISPECIES: TMEM175 family protein [Flavobacterium]|uniref:TMEM175 family protein n=1 Tax=Flavobacterium TaxID=237 RepID=UPI001FCC532B|nr:MULTISPECIES: TMEM175 family protein [Flavobacterium]UOK42531.1 DUF1211 domain-containing protein [Flavobacterium enshiense]
MSIETDLDTKRIQALTDGVFAIAMTIIILEVKIPTELNSIALNNYFFEHTFQELLIYFIGFVTLGILWIGSHFHHHHLMKTDRISSWLNIIFLMFICIIPFSIGFLNNYSHDKLSIIFLSINLILSSAANYLMLWYAWKKTYIKPHFTLSHFTHAKHRILFPIYIYVVIILISFFSTSFVLYLFLIPFTLHIIPEKGNKRIGQS